MKDNASSPRLLAISDIHGHAQGLLTLLKFAQYREGRDRLIMLGDYMNDDLETWETLITIKELVDQGAVALPGNVDLRFAKMDSIDRHLQPLIQWVAQLPLYQIEGNYLFVHAGVRPKVPLELQSLKDLTEIREKFWHADTGLPYTIVFGHTPTFKLGICNGKLWYGNKKIGIDTGAKHGCRLSLIDFTNKLVYSCSTSPHMLYGDMKIEQMQRKESISE